MSDAADTLAWPKNQAGFYGIGPGFEQEKASGLFDGLRLRVRQRKSQYCRGSHWQQ
jgi:hypothetical protein